MHIIIYNKHTFIKFESTQDSKPIGLPPRIRPEIANLLHLLDLDVPEVDRRAGVLALEADPSLGRELGLGPAEPGRDPAAIRVGLGRGPQAHVHIRDRFAVEDDADPLPGAGDRIAVPLAGLLDGALCRGEVSEDRAAV